VFNHSVKGQLAKLLATEDLVVEHKQCDTASVDVHNRVLTLPMWQKASESVYDMLVAHEVGHALFTPDEEVSNQSEVPHQYVNVTEDARVEKLMKRRFAGLPKTFYRGYNELHDDDFFSIEDEDVNLMGLADRINLYFKIGSFINIDFTAEEKVIVDMVDKAETFQDALEAAIALWKFGKKEREETPTKEQKQETPTDGQSGQSNQSSESFDGGDGDSSESGESESEESVDEQSEQQTQENGGENGGEVKTADSLKDNVQNLSEKSQYWGDPFYFEIPKLNLDTLVVKASTIHEYLDGYWNREMENSGLSYSDTFSEVDKQFAAYKKDAQREVNYLVKEFEMKKSANQYSRSAFAKTGVLDTSKLHTYKYSEDLFKKISVVPDGKNHGLIFVLDWSGSMHRQMLPTLKQLFNLVWFCKKTNIPFEVYAFTNEWNHRACDRMDDGSVLLMEHCEKKDGYMVIPDGFSMLNILSSTTKTKDFDVHIRNMFRLGVEMEVYNTYKSVPYSIPYRLNLSGTPLNEAIASLHTIIPDFVKKTKTEKVHCVVLTDGESCNSTRHVNIKRTYDDAEYVGTRSIGQNGYLRCRKTGNSYAIPSSWWQITNLLVQNVRDCFPGMNMIGIRVLENRDFRNWVRRMEIPSLSEDNITKVWAKERSISISSVFGYSEMIGVSGNSLESSKEFDPVENATKAQILASFKKSYGGKKTNKKILSKFISVIA